MEGEKGYGERSARHKRARIGPTCFGFEEVQPAKSSLRDVESSSFLFLFLFLSLSFYPSFSFSTIRFIFLFVRRFYSFLPPVRNGSSTLNSPREKRYPLHASLRIDAGIILTDVISRSPYPLPLLETLADHWPPLFCLQSYYTRATSVLYVYVVEGNV